MDYMDQFNKIALVYLQLDPCPLNERSRPKAHWQVDEACNTWECSSAWRDLASEFDISYLFIEMGLSFFFLT